MAALRLLVGISRIPEPVTEKAEGKDHQNYWYDW